MLRFTGITETAAAFNALSKDLESVETESIQEICDMLVEKAQSKAPVDTGFLRDNIVVESVSAGKGVVTSQADYSIYVEEGTSRQSPQPFMEPARLEAENEAIALVTSKLQTKISYHFGR